MPNATPPSLPIEFEIRSNVQYLNARCSLHRLEGVGVVYIGGAAAFRLDAGDVVAEKLFVAHALELGFAKPSELAKALGWGLREVHRARRAYVAGGVEGLVPKLRGRPQGSSLGAVRELAIGKLRKRGKSLLVIAECVGSSESTVRRTLIRLGLPTAAPVPVQEPLALGAHADAAPEPAAMSAEFGPGPGATKADIAASMQAVVVDAEPVVTSLDGDPDDRMIDRLLAHRGELDDAAPLFKDRERVPHAGVLLVLPLLVASGVLAAARTTFGNIGPAFYGLRTSFISLMFMAFWRIKNAESLKLHAPPELGWVLGLDRAPEMKTLRRKLARLGTDATKVDDFLALLVRQRAASRDEALGYLYVDGHVRVYSGEANLPKAHVARMRIALPATQDVWVNDADGAPLFFVTQEAHPQLVGALPSILKDVRKLVGPGRRVTVVFDRGGWSPALFARMDRDGFDVLTYRKGKTEALPTTAFGCHDVPGSNGRLQYELADTDIEVGADGFKMRQVTRLQPGGHQTHIVTTRRDLAAAEVARRMFDRWRQENFFKYMRQEYAIDALVEHASEPDEGERQVPNPVRKAADKQLRAARVELRKLEAAFGAAAAANPEHKRRTMRGFKIANGAKIGIPLRDIRARVAGLQARCKALPEKVPVNSIRPVVERLTPTRKRLSDGLKMLAYQVETDLVRLATPHYKGIDDDGHKLIVAALKSTASLRVRDGELRVTLAPQSSPHWTRAIAALCRSLDATEVLFPGTRLRVKYGVEGEV